MKSSRRHLLLAATSLSLIAVTGCATQPAPARITDTAARTPQLSTFSKLLGDAGLSETLRSDGPFTVFAPSDAAFKALPAKTLAELSANKELLKSVLSFHVLPGRLSAAEAQNGSRKTLQGANLALAKAGPFLTVEDAVVEQADLMATNGLIQVIDKVLMPPKR